jgi:hypothetical protein
LSPLDRVERFMKKRIDSSKKKQIINDDCLCPNFTRQGQIFPNRSKRNQKSVKKAL